MNHPARTAIGSARRAPRALAGTLTALPLLIQVLIVSRFGVNMPYLDEFFYVPFVYLVRTGQDWRRWIFLQHNEHRMVAMKLILAPLSAATSWNVVAEMYVSVALVGIALWGLWGIYRQTNNRGALAFAPLAFLLCGPAQWFNMLTGIQMSFYFTLLGMVWSFRLLQKATLRGVLAACGFGLLASFSTANGFVVWPIGIAQLAVSRASRRALAVWTSAGVACAALYFHGYHAPPQIAALKSIPVGPGARAQFLFAAVGAPLGVSSLGASAAIGFALLLLVYLLAIRDLRRGEMRSPARAGAYALIAAGVLSAALLAYGRAAFGAAQAVESRYVTFTELAAAGAYLLVMDREIPRLACAAFLVLFGICLAASGFEGIEKAAAWRTYQQGQRKILRTFESQPDTALGSIYFPGDLRQYARYLRESRLSVFHDGRDR
ncbi:MAG: hypothetical protein ACRD16_05830 [Thermoanaerobaculia bacterium]